MYPTEVIELMVIVLIIAVIIIISFFIKVKLRKFGWSFALVVLVAYCVFYFTRPYLIDAQIDKKVEWLEPYLEQQYPNEEWEIITVPHRERGYKHLNPYYIGVIFADESDVTYHYWVENKHNIYQVMYSTDKG